MPSGDQSTATTPGAVGTVGTVGVVGSAGGLAAPRRPLAGSPVARLRPRTGPQILDSGFEVLRFRAATIIALLAILHGPFFIASQLISWFLADHLGVWSVVRNVWNGRNGDFVLTPAEQWACIAGLVSLLGEMLFAVGLAALMREWLVGADPAPLPIVKEVARRLPTILGAWLLALVCKAIGAAFCLVGLVIAVPLFSILAPVIAFEPGGPLRAFNRTRRLVNRASNKALFLTSTMALLSLLISWSIALGGNVAITHFEEFSTIMGVAVTLLLVVARSASTALLYLDIRVRTEGLDLALRAPDTLGRS